MALPDTLQSTISDIKVISRPRDLDPTQLAWKGKSTKGVERWCSHAADAD